MEASKSNFLSCTVLLGLNVFCIVNELVVCFRDGSRNLAFKKSGPAVELIVITNLTPFGG